MADESEAMAVNQYVISLFTRSWRRVYEIVRESWTQETENKSNFLLQVDLDTPKFFIFLNTIFMNNFSISKKLSHYDAYISQKNFKFEWSKIFARKPLKKIRKNMISKLTRLSVTKLIMKFELPDSDDFVFVAILGLHQMAFLYYAQMNCENNYLRYFSESEYLIMVQTMVKKYSKGLSLLVKVNKRIMVTSDSIVFLGFSLHIIDFLLRMQMTACIKSYLMHWATKKDKLSNQKLHAVFMDQFMRVSFPTLVLYVTVIALNNLVGCTANAFCVMIPSLQIDPNDDGLQPNWYSKWMTVEFSQDLLIWCLEKIYILHFMYQDYSAKMRKAEEKKA